MNRLLHISLTATLAMTISLAAIAARADSAKGTWTITTERSAVQLDMRWHSADGRHDSNHSGPINPNAYGISAALNSSGQHTTFRLHREAGDFAFDGWLGNGEGAGEYTLTLNDAFFAALRNRGYAVSTLEYEMAFANLDITTGYVDEMEALGFKSDASELIAMKALDVTAQYVRDLEAAGVTDITQSQVLALRALHIDRNYVNDIAAAGFSRLSANEYVTLKSLHVDGAYISYLRSHGFKNLTVNQVVTMKAERI